MNKLKLYVCCIFTFMFFNFNTFSEEIKKTYLKIEADQLIIKQTPLISEFIGNVYAFDDTNYFWGDKMVIYYDENKKIKLIELESNIKIKRTNEEATGNFALYKPQDEIIEIVGDVVVIKDKNYLYGEKITIDLISSTSIITSNKNKQVSVKIVQ